MKGTQSLICVSRRQLNDALPVHDDGGWQLKVRNADNPWFVAPGLGIVAGAAIGLLIALLFAANLAYGIAIGAALGLVAGAVVDLLTQQA